MNEQHAVNGLTQSYCDGLALNETEDPARYRQAAERGGLFALHDELSAETSAQRSRRGVCSTRWSRDCGLAGAICSTAPA